MNFLAIFPLLVIALPLVASQSDSATNGTFGNLSQERKQQIREEFNAEKKFREEVQKEEQQRLEREVVQKQQQQQFARPVAMATQPITAVQPVGSNQPIAAIPVNQQRTSIDPVQFLVSGAFGNILAPKYMNPEQAGSQLIPPLVGPQLQQQQQRSLQQAQAMQQPLQADARQFMPGLTSGQMQYPGMGSTGALPGFGQALPTFGSYPQNQMTYPNQLGAASMMTPAYQAYNPQMQGAGVGMNYQQPLGIGTMG